MGELTRRSFLKQTIAFSAMAAMRPRSLLGADTEPDPRAHHLLMLGDWGTKKESREQTSVAQAMRRWVERNRINAQALVMLGDNWYGQMEGGVHSKRWVEQFEETYPASHFPGPAYAVLGNHDYENLRGNKVTAQLQYSTSRATRWTMPAKWYSFQFPAQDPVITFICLDSNLPGTKGLNLLLPWSFVMTHEEQAQQDAWFRSELEKPRTTPFLAVVAHHPLYTNGQHRDNEILIQHWDSLLREHRVDFYITGHDHDLQHLQFDGHPTSFVVSGGGGAELVDWSTPPANRGPWGKRVFGFTDLELTRQQVTLRHIGQDARELYAFRKLSSGHTEILSRTA